MEFGIAIVLAGALAVFIVTPVLAAEGPIETTLPVDVTPLTDLKRRRMVVYENLQDLEFEYKAGKISPQDYQSLRENYMAEAAHLMLASQDQEAISEHELWIEREVAARRAQKKQSRTDPYICQKCGFENPLPVKFCGNCGVRIPQRDAKD